jgi:ArsR family transcriptional regulator
VVLVSKALADPTRYRILRGIAGRREVSCQELTGLFGLAQATVSHHLRILTEAGLVSARVEGPFHFYRAHPGALAAHARALARAFPGAARPRTRNTPSRPAERRAPPRR